MEVYRTRLPISHHIIISLGITFGAFLSYLDMSFLGTIFYAVLATIILYMLLNNKACVIILKEDAINIKYMLPYYSNKHFQINEIIDISFEEGEIVFYKFWLSQNEALERRQDKLIITTGDDEYVLFIKTNTEDVKELLKCLAGLKGSGNRRNKLEPV